MRGTTGELAMERKYDEDCKRTEALTTLVTSIILYQHRDNEEH